MKVAIVHDWLTGMRGGEKGLEVLCELFPDAVIHTLVYNESAVSDVIRKMKIKTSFVQNLPGARTKYRCYLPLFPRAVEQFDLTGYDIVISHSHCVAKGAIPRDGALHICYCYTPMRYAWLFYEEYFGGKPAFAQKLISPILARLRRWDKAASSRVDYFVACSEAVRKRINEFYTREADVIHCPVDTSMYKINEAAGSTDSPQAGDFYLVVSAFVPYKRVDLAIEAFDRLGRPLYVIGGGPCEKALKAMARPNVQFLGWKNSRELVEYYGNCRALLFPGEEDFGIVPLEAQAAGRPVIAYRKGGALETVIENETGVFFDEQSSESLADAVRRFERMNFNKERIRQNALRFDRDVFKSKIYTYIMDKYKEHSKP